MIIDLRPVTHQLDTLESTDVLSPEFMTYPALKLEFIRYLTGEVDKPHYPVPAIRLEVDICRTWHKTVAVFDTEWNTIVKEWYGSDDTVTDWEGPQYTFNI